MPSLDARLATAAAEIKNTTNWLRDVAKRLDEDHDTLIKIEIRVKALEDKFEAIEKLKRALIVAIVTAFIGGGFNIAVAIFNMLAKGAPEP